MNSRPSNEEHAKRRGGGDRLGRFGVAVIDTLAPNRNNDSGMTCARSKTVLSALGKGERLAPIVGAGVTDLVSERLLALIVEQKDVLRPRDARQADRDDEPVEDTFHDGCPPHGGRHCVPATKPRRTLDHLDNFPANQLELSITRGINSGSYADPACGPISNTKCEIIGRISPFHGVSRRLNPSSPGVMAGNRVWMTQTVGV